MSATVLVLVGRLDQASGGEMFAPSHVYCAGIAPPSTNALVLSLSVAGLMAADGVAARLLLFCDTFC